MNDCAEEKDGIHIEPARTFHSENFYAVLRHELC